MAFKSSPGFCFFSNPSDRQSPGARRHTVGIRPTNLPLQSGPHSTEPIPVPTQKAAYQQIQQSLIRSRSRSGDSVSAMSGVSSASGGSTLGPLPEERIAPSGKAKQTRLGSPTTSPRSPTAKLMPGVAGATSSAKTRRFSAPPIPDICQMSPPAVQFTMGPPPPGHRRRTSSSSSCGTPPPPVQWQISPNSPTHGHLLMSPLRKGSSTQLCPNAPTLSPIQGSPSKSGLGEASNTAVMQWSNNQGKQSSRINCL
jgi:hypothetical protein